LRNALYTNFIGSHGAILMSGYASSAEKLLTVVFQIFLIRNFGPEGAVGALILGALVFQIPYHRILLKRQPEAARSLVSLQWIWIPSGMVFLAVAQFSGWLVVEDWLAFLLLCFVVAPLPAIILFGGVPNLRERSAAGMRYLAAVARSIISSPR
jgi:hypothetical protein